MKNSENNTTTLKLEVIGAKVIEGAFFIVGAFSLCFAFYTAVVN